MEACCGRSQNTRLLHVSSWADSPVQSFGLYYMCEQPFFLNSFGKTMNKNPSEHHNFNLHQNQDAEARDLPTSPQCLQAAKHFEAKVLAMSSPQTTLKVLLYLELRIISTTHTHTTDKNCQHLAFQMHFNIFRERVWNQLPGSKNVSSILGGSSKLPSFTLYMSAWKMSSVSNMVMFHFRDC